MKACRKFNETKCLEIKCIEKQFETSNEWKLLGK